MTGHDLDTLLRAHRPPVRHPGPASGLDDRVMARLKQTDHAPGRHRVGPILGFYWTLAALAALAVLAGFALPAMTTTALLVVAAAVLCVALPFLILARVARVSVLALIWQTLED